MIDERFVDEPLHVQLGVDEMVIGGHVVDRLAPTGTPVVLVPGIRHAGEAMVPARGGSSLRPRSARLDTPSSSLVGPTCPGLPGPCACRPATCARWRSQLAAVGVRGGLVVGRDTGPVTAGGCNGHPRGRVVRADRRIPLRRRPRACGVAARPARLRRTPTDVHRRAGVLVDGALPADRRRRPPAWTDLSVEQVLAASRLNHPAP